MSAVEEPKVAPADEIDLDDRDLYFNRELSWLEFNQRVLELAEDADIPLLERLKFVAITANNLDEFFMVRVAGLLDQVISGVSVRTSDGRTPQQTLEEIRSRALELTAAQAKLWREELCPALAAFDAGDELEAVAVERTRFGRSGVCDITVTRPADGQVIAEFRGRSRTIERG